MHSRAPLDARGQVVSDEPQMLLRYIVLLQFCREHGSEALEYAFREVPTNGPRVLFADAFIITAVRDAHDHGGCSTIFYLSYAVRCLGLHA